MSDISETRAPDAGVAGGFAFAPGLNWEGLADNRLHRLKRGKHYRGETADALASAEAAAQAMNRGVLVVKEPMGRVYYLWVQFNDGEIDQGDPCPRCRCTELHRIHLGYARCPECQALLRFAHDVVDLDELEDDDDDDVPEELLEHAAEPPRSRPPRKAAKLEQLSDFSDVVLKTVYTSEAKEFCRGVGTNAGGAPTLLLVTYFLDKEGERMPDPDQPGQHVHRVRTMPFWAFEDAIDSERL